MIYTLRQRPRYTMADYNREKPNPGCGHKSGIWTQEMLLFTGDGNAIMSGRIKGYCNYPECEQRFWVCPASRRITRRNSGETGPQRLLRRGMW